MSTNLYDFLTKNLMIPASEVSPVIKGDYPESVIKDQWEKAGLTLCKEQLKSELVKECSHLALIQTGNGGVEIATFPINSKKEFNMHRVIISDDGCAHISESTIGSPVLNDFFESTEDINALAIAGNYNQHYKDEYISSRIVQVQELK